MTLVDRIRHTFPKLGETNPEVLSTLQVAESEKTIVHTVVEVLNGAVCKANSTFRRKLFDCIFPSNIELMSADDLKTLQKIEGTLRNNNKFRERGGIVRLGPSGAQHEIKANFLVLALESTFWRTRLNSLWDCQT